MGPIEHGERCSLKLKFSEGTRKLIIMYVLLGKQGYMYYKENEFISVAYVLLGRFSLCLKKYTKIIMYFKGRGKA